MEDGQWEMGMRLAGRFALPTTRHAGPFDSAQDKPTRPTGPTGEGGGAKEVNCDPGTTWSLQKNMISENEPKFVQAGVEISKKQSQKRTQIAAYNGAFGTKERHGYDSTSFGLG
jgi:hypothetical protein